MSVFEKLAALNVNEHTEKKNGLTYLSWAWAWAEIKKVYPTAKYEIKKFENEQPYLYDEKTGYMVFTTVTIEDITYEMWLPVMDYRNKAIMQPTVMDINKTIMRCLVKNLAMFGLGLYIYAGEDLPEGEALPEEPYPEAAEGSKVQPNDIFMVNQIMAVYPKENRATALKLALSKYKVDKVESLTKEQFVKFREELLKSADGVKAARLGNMVTSFAKKSGKSETEAKEIIETALNMKLEDVTVGGFSVFAQQYMQMYNDLEIGNE